MAWTNHLDLHFFGAVNSCIEIVEFKPEQHAVSVRQVLVADWPVMMFHIPLV